MNEAGRRDAGAAGRGGATAASSGTAAVVAYVGVGSNLGDREAALRGAVEALRATAGVAEVTRSPVYETDPVGPGRQRPYLNAVLRLRTTLSAPELLGRLLAIETRHGRQRGPERNAPRTLDLDLLLYGDARLDASDLTVPHPRLHERGFVLEPLCDLAPGLVHPTLGEPIERLAARVRDPAAVRRRESPRRADPGSRAGKD